MIRPGLLAVLLVLPLLALGGSCPAGQTLINGKCVEVEFIEGCYTYLDRTRCADCEFSKQLFIQITNWLEIFAIIAKMIKLNVALDMELMDNVINAKKDYF